MDRSEMASYQTMCTELRNAGIRAEVFMGGGNMAKQLKYADNRGSPVAVIEGSDEKQAGQVTLKDLALGARLAAEIETNEEWKAQPAQTTVCAWRPGCRGSRDDGARRLRLCWDGSDLASSVARCMPRWTG